MIEFHDRKTIDSRLAEIPEEMLGDLISMVEIIENEFPDITESQRERNGPKAVIIDETEEPALFGSMPAIDADCFEYEEWFGDIRKRVYIISEDGSGLVEYMKGQRENVSRKKTDD